MMKTAGATISFLSGIRFPPEYRWDLEARLLCTLKHWACQFSMAHTLGQLCSSQLALMEYAEQSQWESKREGK
jgi:hypothetical protein